MSDPIDVLTKVIQHNVNLGTHALAETIAAALISNAIVETAVEALVADGWEETHEGPLGVGTLSRDDLANIARTVLGSVGGQR